MFGTPFGLPRLQGGGASEAALSEREQKKLIRYGTGHGLVGIDEALTWIAFGSALPHYAWERALNPCVALWPWIEPEALVRCLDDIEAGQVRASQDGIVGEIRNWARKRRLKLRRASGEPLDRVERTRLYNAQVAEDEILAEVQFFRVELGKARFDARKVSRRLHLASSELRLAALAGKVSLYVRVLEPDVVRLITGDWGGQGPIKIPAQRFEQPFIFSPDGFSLRTSSVRNTLRTASFNASIDGLEIMTHWQNPDPEHHWSDAETNNLAPAPQEKPLAKNLGGRPRLHNWDDFHVEVGKWLAQNGGDPSLRPALQRHMTEWCEDWPKAPDESTIRGRLARYFID